MIKMKELKKHLTELEEKVEELERRIDELSKRTVSQATTEETSVPYAKIIDEWINGEDDAE